MFLRALKRLLSRRLVLLDPRKEVLDRDLLLRLRNDAHAYYRLLHKVEEIKKDFYVPIDLDEFTPLDTNVEVPDFLPEDL